MPSSHSKWRAGWFYLQIENSDPVLVVPEEQPDKIPEWTAKPALTPSLQSFIGIIDDLRTRGLLGYEVAADFIGRWIQPLQARAHPAFDYSGPEDTTRVSRRGIFSYISDFIPDVHVSPDLSSSCSRSTGLDNNTVERRVGQVMISSPLSGG
jgi:hypothetical protein